VTANTATITATATTGTPTTTTITTNDHCDAHDYLLDTTTTLVHHYRGSVHSSVQVGF
jgi:hypothetical protein